MHPLLKRFLLSLFIAGLTFWMSLESTFTMHRNGVAKYPLLPSGYTVYRGIPELERDIKAFQQKKKALPKDLRTLENWTKSSSRRGYWACDGWHREILYQRNGQSFRLLSYGHDGKPGGIGLDADIIPSEKRRGEPPTFWQFLTYSETAFLRMACVGAALFAFFVGMYAGDKDARENKKAGSVETLFSIALMVGISVIGAVFMGGLEYPSGH